MAKNATRVSAKEQKPTCISGASHEEIQKKAYHIWETEGKPGGKDWDIWLRAEKEVCTAVKK